MTSAEVMAELKKMGDGGIRKTFINDGAPVQTWGVKIGDMKTIVKKIKRNHDLALELYNTGIPDAMYFAGLISDPKKMSKKELQLWAEQASWHMISEYIVAGVAAESSFALEMARKWMASKNDMLATTGWNTYALYISITPNDQLDIKEIRLLMKEVENKIHQAPNRVRYVMNGFLISAGGYIPELTSEAIKIGNAIGNVNVEMGGTACKVPSAPQYIQRMIERGMDAKKRKSALC